MKLGNSALRILAAVIAGVVVLTILGVVLLGNYGTPGVEFYHSGLSRDTSPNVTREDFAELVAGNTGFALDLYQRVRASEGNLFFSPYSISLALAMTYAGARGPTAQEMAEVLRFTLPQERLHPAFDALDLALMAQNSENFRLNIANSIWGQIGFEFKREFLDVLAVNYGAGLRGLDFQGDPEAARVRINDWVGEQTNEKIKDLIPLGAIDTYTRLVLTNAIYFNAMWQHPFSENLTADGVFTLRDGSQVTVPMMSWPKSESIRYSKGEGYQAVELPYRDTSVAMLVILPESFEEFEAGLTVESLREIVGGLERQNVVVRMPKFRFEFPLDLTNALAGMGMPTAFTDRADFTGMADDRLFISKVLHKSFVSVDERGTEAAAATAVIMELTATLPPPINVSLDHPFIFLIHDTSTGAVLFLGRVLDPRS
ncbi:MAG: serpin family protein [Candidatus Hadarchaeum sp.]|uniref:serpin family protein n=1 Tax=Candidatus Hadarchaeum sp. TaxID=2883567 RepID=UPI003D0A83F2